MQICEHDSLLTIEWFQANYMKLNEEKRHFFISRHKHELFWVNIGRSEIWESETQKLLGIIVIDRNLRFDEYILWQCKKVNRKLCVLVRICKFMTIECRRVLSWWKSSFGYCPLVWICCDRSRNNRIIYLHERALSRSSHQRCSLKKGVLRNFAKLTGKFLCQSLFFNKVAGLRPATLLKKRLWHTCFPVNFAKFLRNLFYRTPLDDCFSLRVVYDDSISSIVDLLNSDHSVSVHYKNIHGLGIDLYNSRSNISGDIMNELFEQRIILDNIRSQSDFTTGPINTINNWKV